MMKHSLLKSLTATVVSFLLGVPAFAQNVTISGTVYDETNQPLPGVGVLQQGTTNGTMTDVDGKYSISVPAGSVVEFSCIGYTTQTITASTTSTVNINLSPDVQVLEETVVVGYGVQRKSDVTGAISSVKSGDLEHRTVTTVNNALQGKTAGINVVASNAPGAASSIRVRGFSSNHDVAPLYVVDGVRLDDINGIDPNDIESMEILKDGASAAIYGAQAGNGVVLITTKKGSKAANDWGTVTFEYQHAFESLAHTPRMLNAEEYIQYESELTGVSVETYTQNAMLKGWDGETDTDWWDAAWETGSLDKYALTFQNATDKGSYYVSLNYLFNDGIVKDNRDYYERLSGNVNAEHKIKSWLTVGTTNVFEKYRNHQLPMNVTGYSGNIVTQTMHMDPLTKPTYAPDEITPEMQSALDAGYTLLTDEDGNYYGVSSFSDDQYNPLIQIHNNHDKSWGTNVTGSAYANIAPIKGLVFTSRFGYKIWTGNSKGYEDKYYGFSSASNSTIQISSTTEDTIYWQWENFANYTKTIADDHTITAMAGMSFTKSRYNYTYALLADSENDAVLIDDPYRFGDIDNGIQSSDSKAVGGGTTINTSISYYGRLGYSYKDKYMIQGSIRADAYDLSKLDKNNRWGYFPAVSAGWTVTEEPFMDFSRDYLDYLKLRASWGQNGSIAALSGYLYSNSMVTGHTVAYYNQDGSYTLVQSAYPSTMGNDDLKWETSEQLDFGADARLFNDRLTIGIDWYNKKTKDLLVEGVTASLIAGGTASPMNAGDVVNHGWEFEVGWQDQIGDFSYGVRANLATLTNKVTYLHPSITRISGTSVYNNLHTVFEEGYPVWHFYGYKFDYIDENGDAVMKDINDDGIINENDKTYIGDAIPDFTYGITLTAAYKGFDFTMFGTGSHGNDIFNCYLRTDGQNTYNMVKSLMYDGRWQEGMAAHEAKVIGAANTGTLSNYANSDAMVFDASFFKIKQIQLGYTLPDKLLRKIWMKTFRVYVSLEDFFTFTGYEGLDPEANGGTGSAMGVDTGAYPASKKLIFGVNVSF